MPAAARRPPPFVVAQIKFKCPQGPDKVFEIVGPTADAALRKAARFDKKGPGVPKYIAMYCRAAGVALVQRGTRAGLQGVLLGGHRRSRRRRRRR
jgi:hypothetical protein